MFRHVWWLIAAVVFAYLEQVVALSLFAMRMPTLDLGMVVGGLSKAVVDSRNGLGMPSAKRVSRITKARALHLPRYHVIPRLPSQFIKATPAFRIRRTKSVTRRVDQKRQSLSYVVIPVAIPLQPRFLVSNKSNLY